jgi:hypothetical protein
VVDIQIEQVPENIPDALKLFAIRIVVNNIPRVRSLFDQIKVYRSTDSTDGVDGTWTELSGPGTRITLVTNGRNYTFIDRNGNAAYWYRITYFNTATKTESPASSGQLGIPSPALAILSVEELKTNYLFGLDLTDDSSTPFPDSLFQHFIEAATQYVQDKLDIVLPATRILDETQDFIREDYDKYIFMQLINVPVLSVERVHLVLPTNQEVIDYDLNWVHVDKDSGHLEIVPGAGQLTLGQTGAFLPLVFGGQKYLPQAFHIDYTAGFLKCPADIKDTIGMIASFGPLNIAGDLIGGPGIASQSISIDGISQSINTTSSPSFAGYGARILQYQKILKDMWPTLKGRYHPLRMVVV